MFLKLASPTEPRMELTIAVGEVQAAADPRFQKLPLELAIPVYPINSEL
jgi:hypothetical protein